MTIKYRRTRQRTNNLRDELTWGWGGGGGWGGAITVHVKVSGAVASLLRQVSVYSHTLLLILSSIERLICPSEISLIGSTSFGFAQIRYMIFKIPY